MTIFRADLHCHSNFSDGTDTPEELIDKALEIGLSGLSITDHDTVNAYERALPYANEKGLSLIVGVEFSSFYKTEPIHILGYQIDRQHNRVKELCDWHSHRRERRNRAIIEKLQGLGVSISYEELLERAVGKQQTLGRPHIAYLLVEKGIVSSIKGAFDSWIGEGKKAYVSGEVFPVEKTIEVIHAAKGAAILAHPHLIKSKRILKEVLAYPFDGIEGYYARMSSNQELPFVRIGKEKGWLITGGSDYHGDAKIYNLLGSSWVGEETFEQLKSWKNA
jgi:3',5'-nucleoside bisphosphate phosphatase